MYTSPIYAMRNPVFAGSVFVFVIALIGISSWRDRAHALRTDTAKVVGCTFSGWGRSGGPDLSVPEYNCHGKIVRIELAFPDEVLPGMPSTNK